LDSLAQHDCGLRILKCLRLANAQRIVTVSLHVVRHRLCQAGLVAHVGGTGAQVSGQRRRELIDPRQNIRRLVHRKLIGGSQLAVSGVEQAHVDQNFFA
jgi:hypothetical protein